MKNEVDIKLATELKLLLEPLVPGVKLFAFGSRIYGSPNQESDLDILEIIPGEMDSKLKWSITDAIFPVSLQFKTFIHLLPITKSNWEKSAQYYLLKQDIKDRMMEL